MFLKVEMVGYEDLTESQKEDAPNNGCGKEDAQYLRVTYNGEVIAVESDAMEPEDASFNRDLSWVKPLIQKAYELGLAEPM